MQLGEWEVRLVSGGRFRLDGGGMFGTVPKAVWEKLHPADGNNTILMDAHCLLIRGRGRTILVDTGNGDKEDAAFMARYQFEGRGILDANLAREGVRPEDLDLVVLTHLHFDHAGGATRFDGEGRLVPSFPNARHVLQARDLHNARTACVRERASYLPGNWEPLVAAGLLDLVDGPVELLPGLSLRPVPGHTPGMQAVVVEGGGRKLLYTADLFPTSSHVQPAWIMAYDLDVVTTVAERVKVLDEVAGTDAVLVFAHDPRIPSGTVGRNARGRYEVAPLA